MRHETNMWKVQYVRSIHGDLVAKMECIIYNYEWHLNCYILYLFIITLNLEPLCVVITFEH